MMSVQTDSKDDIIKILDFLTDNIFVEFGGLISQHIVDIPMGTYCAQLLTNPFVYTYEAKLRYRAFSNKKKRHLAKFFNFT